MEEQQKNELQLAEKTQAQVPSVSQSDWELMHGQAATLLESGFLPESIKTPSQAMMVILKGRELGIPMVRSLEGIDVISGRTAVKSELQLAMIFQNCPGAVVEYKHSDEKYCTVRTKRPLHAWQEFTFTMEDARRAGLLGKSNWKKYPKNMLRWRAVSDMASAVYPDAIAGLSYTFDDLGADVDEAGDVVLLPPKKDKNDRANASRLIQIDLLIASAEKIKDDAKRQVAIAYINSKKDDDCDLNPIYDRIEQLIKEGDSEND